jgi:hypothetical protein
VPSSSRKFQGLLTDPPKPLPDDDQFLTAELPGAVGPEPAAAASEPLPALAAAAAPAGKPGRRPASRPESEGSAAASGTPAPAGPAGETRAATTVRLRPQAAVELNSAWLEQRMHVNPKLSYPEFASEIVRLGLAAFKRQAKRA